MVKDSRNRDICDEPIAGRGKYEERFKRHAEISACIGESWLKVFSNYSNEEYYRYLYSSLEEGVVDQIRSVVDDVNRVLAVFHDVGKCTQSNQTTLRECGTARNHEFMSASVLCVVLREALRKVLRKALNDEELMVVLSPLILATVLHHHATRGGNFVNALTDVVGKLMREDLECCCKCLKSIADLLPRPLANVCVREVIKIEELRECSTWFSKIYSSWSNNIYSSPSRKCPSYLLTHSYKVAVLLATALMVSDNIAAKLNRELYEDINCESLSDDIKLKVLEEFRGEFVYDLLRREEVYWEYRRKLKEILNEAGDIRDGRE